ncbi:MAG TPA: sulfotransferase [Gemmatimonadales bacterium]|nr:sulfotransferase [Gemmatimonadales bacterium]
MNLPRSDPTQAGVVRVLYIGSWGRSGSTLLDLMLGQLPGFVSVGELRYLWERGLRNRERCGCGVPVPECPFWGAVLQRAFGGVEPLEVARLHAQWRRVDGLGRLPWLAGPWRPAGFDRELAAYREVLARLYAAVQVVSGARVLVDSSKYAAYGLILAGVPTLDLRVLHLVRDSRAVAYSWTRQKRMPEVGTEERYMPRKGSARSAFYWSLENLALQLLRRAAGAYQVLRYEDLTADPGRWIAAATGALGLPTPDTGFLHTRRLSLGENHTVAGNPVRFTRGEVVITPDTAWTTGLRPADRRVVTALTWPLLARYGFPSGAVQPPRDPGV